MKSIIVFWFILIFFSSSIYSQWTNQNLVPDGNHLWSTFFVDDNTGWIVGSAGLIKKTTNSGLDWLEQNSGTTFTLKSVQFVDQNVGWISGEDGLIIKTSDGGQSWFEQASGTAELLTDVQFLDLNIGYVVGYNEIILKTTDGGLTWFTQHSGSAYDLYSVDFVDTLLGYAVGGRDTAVFLKTTDGGLNWLAKHFYYSTDTKILNCVEFIDSNVGFVGSGNGTGGSVHNEIDKTTDGGETWGSKFSTITLEDTLVQKEESTILHEKETINRAEKIGIHTIYFKDANNGYAVGGQESGWKRTIVTTTDAGVTWQSKYYGDEQTGLLSIFVNNDGYGWAVGYYGVIYITEDNGISWSQILSGTQGPWTGDWINAVFMVNDSVGWAGGYRLGKNYGMKSPILLYTNNGGKIWKTRLDLGIGSMYEQFEDIFFISENTGWASCDAGGGYKTIDGGQNWLGTEVINKVFFINQNTGWGAGRTYSYYKGIYKSTDGGTNWVQKSSNNILSIYFSDINNGLAVGAEGSILKSTDSGESWISKTSGTTSDLNSVQFYSSSVGMCVGNSGTVLISTNGGENWYPKNVGTTSKLNSVIFINATTAWIVGSGGTILNTTDLGDNWISYDGLTAVNLSSIYFANGNTGWVVGENNIFKYQKDIIPVELLSFTAIVNNNKVLLNWQTATELNNYGYEIERVSSITTSLPRWETIGFIEGNGNSSSPKSYSYVDNSPIGGNKINYRLKQIDTDGRCEYSDVVEVVIAPNQFELSQNYPNPFNPSTKIKFTIPPSGNPLPGRAVGWLVTIKVYDILGNEVATLVNENKEPGIYELELDARSLASGTYIYRMVSENFVESKKMVLLR